ncbi:hypothetical protein [Rubrivivax gelatinosus]|uniref:hypothetical protein n=1 Tax=Rubrivivax gelatinosus TaxID=28068 RepID=UPI0009DAE52F|nr:hypothetical protein [Rubrivivax gelatinosus]MBG6083082.1 putative membrane protein [Rubrivivax gelatinosus]
MSAAIHGLARSSAPDVRNPLLRLPAAAAFEHLPEADRRQMRAALDAIRRSTKQIADDLWQSGRVRKAAYWRACSVYAGHAARLVHHRSSPSPVSVVREAGGSLPAALRGLVAHHLRAAPAPALALLAQLLVELRADAHAASDKSWSTAKAPMASYWADVATISGRCARAVSRMAVDGIAVPHRLAA